MNLLEQLSSHSSNIAPSRVIGIDLGTTNSTVAQVRLPISISQKTDKLVTIQRITRLHSK